MLKSTALRASRLTSAHEAYPGHHLQFLHRESQHPSKLRRLFAHAVFYEGWTSGGQMSVDSGVAEEPTARLGMLHDALWRAHRILIDCGLQTGSTETTTRRGEAPDEARRLSRALARAT